MLPLILCAQTFAVPWYVTGRDTAFALPNLQILQSHYKAVKIGTGSTSEVLRYNQKSPQINCLGLIDLFCSTFLDTEKPASIPATIAVKQFSRQQFQAYRHESLVYTALGNGSPFLLKAYGFLEDAYTKDLVIEWANAEYNDLFKLIHENSDYKPKISKIRYIAANLVLSIEFMHKKGIAHQDIKSENILVKYSQP